MKIPLSKNDLLTLILISILFVPNFFVLFYFKEISGSLTMLFAYFVLSLVIWILPLSFLPRKIYFGIAFLFLLLSPLEIIFVRNLGIPMTEGFIESVFRTNYSETMEQITSNLLILILFVGLICVYIFLFIKIKNTFFNYKLRIGIAAFFFLFNVVLFANMYRVQVSENASVVSKIKSSFNSTQSKYRKTYPTDLVLNTIKTISNFNKNKTLRKQIEQFSFHAKSNNDKDEEEIFVLVIGESARYDNFHVNGYNRNTTPIIDSVKNLLSFSNVYSGAVVTTYSVPMILTRATPHDLSIQNKEKTVLDAFKEAGFYTAWFANQNSDYPVTRRLIDVADNAKVNFFDVNAKNFFDGLMLPDFEQAVKSEKKKKFILIHSLGSHFRYTNRYPKEFEKFKPVMDEFGYNELNFENRNKVLNAYDNSILYTDFFLNQLIDQLRQTHKKALLLYLSDHGENLFDDDNKIFGHGTANPTKYEYHIPYFIWFSDAYKNSNPEKVAQLRNRLNLPASSTSTFYTLLDLANISYSDSENELIYSLSSKKYKAPKERFILNSDRKVVKIKD